MSVLLHFLQSEPLVFRGKAKTAIEEPRTAGHAMFLEQAPANQAPHACPLHPSELHQEHLLAKIGPK